MTARDKTTIKSYFDAGDVPNAAQYIDLVDSYADVGSVGTAATGAEIDTGTDTLKYATPKAIRDSGIISGAVSGEISALTDKPTPVDADILLGENSANSYSKIKVTWANIKSGLKSYFDGLNKGSSFPGSPSSGDVFFRTDIGWHFFWNGTYWLTTFELLASIPYRFYSSTQTLESFAVRQDYRPYITRCVINALVQTTNNGSNYWYMACRAINQAYNSSDDLYVPTTSSISPDVRTHFYSQVNRLSTHNPLADFDWALTKSGSPGNIAFNSTIYYRLRAT